ncbi:related to Cell division control protein 50 [Hanseniaspora guilliermondii]|uniref:Related to Cell division control protein 50 n=1 Tax=Hanseniaspora guilliermondii TaxID=56406 RepID=A0A1L0B2Z0_9ASCO|nr:related to Cell division control protein 50 [Hanseniaspora guilliermondii]
MVDRLNTNNDPDSFSRIIDESIEDFNTFELSDEGIDQERVNNNIGSVTTQMNGALNKKPPNTAFRQQRLKAWQPILSPKTMIPTLLMVVIVFAPIGIGLLVSFLKVQHIIVDYSHCKDLASGTYSSIPSKYLDIALKETGQKKAKDATDAMWKYDSSTGTCTIKFDIDHDIKKNLYMYYKLTNFYQNHRKYVESYDLKQLQGHAVGVSDLNDFCKPLKEIDGKPIYPCGLIANSLFNDSISLQLSNTETKGSNYQFSSKDIAWKSDRKIYKKTKYNPADIVPPPNWAKKYPDGYNDDNLFDISEYEDLLVWMRTAGMPSFYKLKGKNEKDDLPKGSYEISIEDNYPVHMFGGTKSIVITSSSVIGGRNISLPLMYLITAVISLSFAIIFFINIFIIKPKKASITEHSYLSNDNEMLQQQLNPLREIM